MAVTVPQSMKGTIASLGPAIVPLIEGGAAVAARSELAHLRTAIQTAVLLIPQTAVKAPTAPVDGMIRLSRAPWRPVSGQTTDQWVYFDGAGQIWRLLATAPIDTG